MMSQRDLFWPIISLLVGSAIAFNTSEQFDHEIALDDVGNFMMYWKITGWTKDDNITFELHVRTKAWIGLGFNNQGSMIKADIVIAGVAGGNGYLLDKHGPPRANGMPIPDTRENYKLSLAAENDTHTVVKFWRKLVTCDDEDYPITNDTIRVLWAMGDKKDVTEADGFQQHLGGKYGVKSMLLLLVPTNKASPFPNTTKTLDIQFDKFRIPNQTTTYWCKLLKLPMSMGPQHIIKYEPIFSPPANEIFIHHILIYHCMVDMKFIGNSMTEGPCYDIDDVDGSELQMLMPLCTTTWICGFAIGGGPQTLPDHLALPIMQQYSSPWIVMEIHYNNPLHRPNVIDSSGIRWYMEPKATSKRTELGVLLVGQNVAPESIIIPPNMEITTHAFCDASCTLDLPPKGIDIYSVFFHSHTSGTGFRLQLIRNGVEQPPIMEDLHYDFDYQESRVLTIQSKIMPGDVVLLDCIYASPNRTKTTYAGLTTNSEMCFAYVQYTPLTKELSACIAGADMDSMAKAIGATVVTTNQKYVHPITKKTTDLETIMDTYPWANGTYQAGNTTYTGYRANQEKLQQLSYEQGQYFWVCTGLNKDQPYVFPNESGQQVIDRVKALANAIDLDPSMLDKMMKIIKPIENRMLTINFKSKLPVITKPYLMTGQCPALPASTGFQKSPLSAGCLVIMFTIGGSLSHMLTAYTT